MTASPSTSMAGVSSLLRDDAEDWNTPVGMVPLPTMDDLADAGGGLSDGSVPFLPPLVAGAEVQPEVAQAVGVAFVVEGPELFEPPFDAADLTDLLAEFGSGDL